MIPRVNDKAKKSFIEIELGDGLARWELKFYRLTVVLPQDGDVGVPEAVASTLGLRLGYHYRN
jgi:hypothetical protein